MARMTGGEAIVDGLIRHGIDTVFGLPGVQTYGLLHEMKDQLATLKGLVKHADRIEHPSEAPIKVARAFQEMLSGRPGPVSIEMPWEQFAAVAEVTPVDPLPRLPNPTPDPERI